MKIACLCPTYRRPKCLPSAVWQYVNQRVAIAETKLFVLDDAGQYPASDQHGICVMSQRERFPSFGAKYNELARVAIEWGADALIVWEDDDIYLPLHIAAHHEQLAGGAAWSVPEKKFTDYHRRREVPVDELTLFDLRVERRLSPWCHGSWAYSTELFLRVGGYPEINGGFDMGMADRCLSAAGKPASYTPKFAPQYLYRWQSAGYSNASGWGDEGYANSADKGDAEPQSELTPALDSGATRIWELLGESPQ